MHKWKIGLFTLFTIYIIMGMTMLRKKPQKSLKPDYQEIKTLVGYSWEYQISEQLQEKLVCDDLKRDFVNDKTDFGADLKWHPSLGVFTLGAFFDQRLSPYNYLRIVGLVPENVTIFCQVWFEEENSKLVGVARKASLTPIWSKNWGGPRQQKLIPNLISCLIPPEVKKVPKLLSLTDKPCIVQNETLTLFKPKNEKLNKFAVCVKPLDFKKDITKTLTEWLNINFLLGADKIIIYFYKSAEGVLKRLKTRLKNKNIQFIKFSTNFTFGDTFKDKIWNKRKLEILAYNDCFYRNQDHVDFIIPLDIDEIIVPKKAKNWKAMFSKHFGVDSEKMINSYSSFSVRNAYFFANYPQEALDLLPTNVNLVNNTKFRRNIRSLRYSPKGESTKSFIYSPNTLSVFNHFSMHVIGPTLRQYFFPLDVVQLNHYRDDCDSRLIEDCPSFLNYVTLDYSLDWFYKKIKGLKTFHVALTTFGILIYLKNYRSTVYYPAAVACQLLVIQYIYIYVMHIAFCAPTKAPVLFLNRVFLRRLICNIDKLGT